MTNKTLMVAIGLAACAGVGACAYDSSAPARSPQVQAELDKLLAGHVAAPAQKCLSEPFTHGMRVIDDHTIAYPTGGTVYVNNLRSACNGLGEPGYTLVTERLGGSAGETCDGDTAKVVDLSTGMIRGFCGFGTFTPYRKAN